MYALRRFAAFPLRSGDVTIGPMSVEISTASVMDIFAPDRVRPNIKRSGTPLVLHVKPLPEQNKPAGEIAVGRFKLNAKLDRNQALAGDALTLTAVVQGEGNIRTVQVAPPKLPNVDVLQPEVKDLVEAPNDLLTGTREYRWLIVPHDPGHLTIPPLTLASFDPRSQKYEQVQSSPLADRRRRSSRGARRDDAGAGTTERGRAGRTRSRSRGAQLGADPHAERAAAQLRALRRAPDLSVAAARCPGCAGSRS